MKYDICVFGGCSLDAVYLQNKDLSYNEKPNSIFFGGKGANQAVASARAGAKVVMLTRLGNDEIGQNIIKNLKNNKIETKFIELGIKLAIAPVSLTILFAPLAYAT